MNHKGNQIHNFDNWNHNLKIKRIIKKSFIFEHNKREKLDLIMTNYQFDIIIITIITKQILLLFISIIYWCMYK
jgi:hypothetical protein